MESKIIEHTAISSVQGRQRHKVLLEVVLLPDERMESIQVRHPTHRTSAPVKWYEDPRYSKESDGSEKDNLSVTSWHLNMNRSEQPAVLTDEEYDHIHVVARVKRGDVEIVQEGIGILMTPYSGDGPWADWTPDRITVRTSTSKWVTLPESANG